MTILDQLEAAERAAKHPPAWDQERSAALFALLLHKHAADLIAVARAAEQSIPQEHLEEALAPLLASEDES